MPDAQQFDMVVIGAGPAGCAAANTAAFLGRTVALVEKCPAVGGAAINTGTIPSKTLRETALAFSGLKSRALTGSICPCAARPMSMTSSNMNARSASSRPPNRVNCSIALASPSCLAVPASPTPTPSTSITPARPAALPN